ncbi:MAG: hypothetical protein LW809_03655 [Vampirovibrionales bacterium]|jgi:hypothetical protein|nr:hypothetical protein [Vampirovibrionales bacterium]
MISRIPPQPPTPPSPSQTPASKPAQEKLEGLERLKAQPFEGNRGELLKELGVNFRRSLFQDTTFFKVALAPIASILLVTARVNMALKAAQAAERDQSPEKAEYAKEQALMTITREVAGFGLSFGLMSLLNILTDKPVQSLFGYTVEKPDVTGPVKALSHAFQILIGGRKSIMKAPKALGAETVIKSIEEEGLRPNFIQKGMRKILPHLAFDATLKTLSEQMKAGMKNVRSVGVPLFSAGISVYLAGWLLERTALLKTDAILANIKQKRHKQQENTSQRQL